MGREGSKGAEGNRDAAGARAGTLVLGEDGREREMAVVSTAMLVRLVKHHRSSSAIP